MHVYNNTKLLFPTLPTFFGTRFAIAAARLQPVSVERSALTRVFRPVTEKKWEKWENRLLPVGFLADDQIILLFSLVQL